MNIASIWAKIEARLVPNDNEIKQIFHFIDLEQYSAKTLQAKQEASNLRQFVEKNLVRNIVDNAQRDIQGQVLIQGIPIRLEDAAYFAMQDIQHFQSTDTHLKHNQLVAMRDNDDGDMNANTAYGFMNHSYHTNEKTSQNKVESTQHKLIFDGQYLTDYQYIHGKLVRKVAYPATSGVLGSTDPRQPNHGPIPSGTYYLDTK